MRRNPRRTPGWLRKHYTYRPRFFTSSREPAPRLRGEAEIVDFLLKRCWSCQSALTDKPVTRACAVEFISASSDGTTMLSETLNELVVAAQSCISDGTPQRHKTGENGRISVCTFIFCSASILLRVSSASFFCSSL